MPAGGFRAGAPVIAGESIDGKPAQRFNRMIVEFARTGRDYGALALPFVRSGVAVGDLALLALAAVFNGKGDDPEMAAKHAMSTLKVLGRRPLKDGAIINDENHGSGFSGLSVSSSILEANVPLWRPARTILRGCRSLREECWPRLRRSPAGRRSGAFRLRPWRRGQHCRRSPSRLTTGR